MRFLKIPARKVMMITSIFHHDEQINYIVFILASLRKRFYVIIIIWGSFRRLKMSTLPIVSVQTIQTDASVVPFAD